MTPDASRHDPRPVTGAQRVAKSRALGRQIAVILRDPVALAALTALERKYGGPTAAVTAALRATRK